MTDLPPPPAAFFADAFATGPVMGILRGYDPGAPWPGASGPGSWASG